ncbi:MFS transporter [Rhodococcus opacus]|uniref:Putative MFS transporter n=1 Tax=Rhodococcus opacus (strain B4) TaxID=632772 RepID=C1B329_RHOOB|nr:MFS transporter [Rhodococcus opacus]BAH54946.1 putative MFS transporter [Rhodococcus opacus B4]
MSATHVTETDTRGPVASRDPAKEPNRDRRLSAALWCAGLATFALMYAPQGLLTQIGHDASVSAAQASLLVSAATLGLALSVLPWARFSDRVGRPTAMRYAAATAGLLAVAVPWLPTFEALVAGRFVQGVALGGLPALAMTLLHEAAAPARTAALAGSYVAATSLGGLGGRLLVVPVAEHLGWRPALAILGVGLAILMAVLIVLLPARRGPCSSTPSNGSLVAHLRDARLLALFGIGALLVGGMVAVFNYLPFRLEAAPYHLAPTVVSLIFLAYLAGTVGSRAAGWLVGRLGHRTVLVLACTFMAGGTVLSLGGSLVLILLGLAAVTAGLFVGHAVASGMVGAHATTGRAQATALYNVSYYAGSSLFGWVGGVAWASGRWVGVAVLVLVLTMLALGLALLPKAKLPR